MGAALAMALATRFDWARVAGCNDLCALLSTPPVKFLDLLNKPVRFRLRSLHRNPAAKDRIPIADLAPAHRTSTHTAPDGDRDAVDAAEPSPLAATQAARQAGTADSMLSQHMDEAALLFATAQPDAAIRVLSKALGAAQPGPTERERRAWYMLLELHEALSQRAAFDGTALAYAQRFETSPPQWRSPVPAPKMIAQEHAANARLVLALRDRLDAGAQASFAQWRQRSAAATRVTLDLASVTAVELDGCRRLLALLADWQQRGLRVELRPCDTLLAMLRERIQSGRRDEDDAGWRLLIELLRLAGDVERYEDACLAYSLTYEMSPPAAPPPVINDHDLFSANRSQGGAPASRHPPVTQGVPSSAAFRLPEIIDLPIDALLIALRVHAPQQDENPVLALDASCLQRIDFHAAAPLQSAMTELAAGKPVEWQGVSFLVSTLLQLTSSSTMPGIINRKP